MLTLETGAKNYTIGDKITVSGTTNQLFLMPVSFSRKVRGFFLKVDASFVFRKGMTFKNGTPIINGNYHIVSLVDRMSTPPFYFSPVQEMNGFYMWSYQMDANRSGTFTLSSGDKDPTPFAMPKNSISVRFPKDATTIVPKNTNSIFLFTEDEYISVVLNLIENSYCGDLYEKAGKYFEDNKMEDYLFGISVSGGACYWTTDKIEKLARDIETGVIQYGNYKNGSKIKHFNTIVVDLEHLSDELDGSGIDDKDAYEADLLAGFIDCFKRIKRIAPWCIVVTEAHSGTFAATREFIDGINQCEYVDYFSPQLYTWHYVGCIEYTRTWNNEYSWGKFYTAITTNPQYEYRGSSMIAPSLGFTNTTFEVNGTYGRTSGGGDGKVWGTYIDTPTRTFSGKYNGLYKGAGTNEGYKPFFESADSILTATEIEDGETFPNPHNKYFHITYPKGKDRGAADFFGKMFRTENGKQKIGGSIQFANGDLTF
jgi:hypothetical protein